MESKSIFKSKTAWANVATMAVMVATVFNFDLTAEEATVIVGGVFTAVNVIARLVTKQPAHVVAPGKM